MEYRAETTVICFDDALLKHTALFHNNVIPCITDRKIREQFLEHASHLLPAALPPPQLVHIFNQAESRTGYAVDNEYLCDGELDGGAWCYSLEKDLLLTYLVDYHNKVLSLPVSATHGALPYLVVELFDRYIPWAVNFDPESLFGLTPESPSVILTNLQLIDAAHLTWEQIVELRKDKDSMNSLRDLRLFMYREFKNETSRAYIEDTMMQLIQRYKRVADKWSLDTAAQTLSISLSNAMISGAGATLAAVLFGSTLTTAAAAGLAASLGQVLLKFSGRMRAKTELQRSDPVHYLIEIETRSLSGFRNGT